MWRGLLVAITSRAAFQTSASTQPPPIVPDHRPILPDQQLRAFKAGNGPADLYDGRQRALLPQISQVDQFVEYVHFCLYYTGIAGAQSPAYVLAGSGRCPKLNLRPMMNLNNKWSVPCVTPTPIPALNSQSGLTFRSIEGTICCC